MAWTLSASRAVYTGCYIAAGAIAAGVGLALTDASPLLRATLAGAAATLFLYLCGVVFKNSGFYDVYWSLYPVVAGAAWMFAHDAWHRLPACLALGATALWGLRLTFNWARHFEGLDHEDWRYVDLRSKTGKAYPLASFGALHLLPFTLVTLGTLPLHVAIASPRPLGALHVAALVVGVVAVVLESVSDEQLRRFRRQNDDPQAFMCSGLWAYSRHPNYCGEVMYWWSAALFGLASSPSLGLEQATLVLGALGVTAMVLFASIPMAEVRALGKRPRFADYQRRVSRLVPWFPARG